MSVVSKLDGISGRGFTGRLTMDQKSRPTKMSLFHKNESPDTCYLTTPVFPAKTDFCFDFCIFTTPLAHHTRSILLVATPILLAQNIRYCLTATPTAACTPQMIAARSTKGDNSFFKVGTFYYPVNLSVFFCPLNWQIISMEYSRPKSEKSNTCSRDPGHLLAILNLRVFQLLACDVTWNSVRLRRIHS